MRKKRGIRRLSGLRFAGKLTNLPGVAGAKEFGEIAGAALGNDVLDLLVHGVFIAREVVPRARTPMGVGKPGRCSMCESKNA